MSLSHTLENQTSSFNERRFLEQEASKNAVSRMGLWITAMQKRKDGDTNSNVVVTGEPGIGKSTLSLVTAEKMAPEIFIDHPQEAIEKYVTFSGSEFGRAIRDSPDGSIIIGDEFGQQMQHRNYMKRQNIALSNVLQGFRFKKYITFLNLPGLHYIDVDAQGLLTWMANVNRRGRGEVFRVTHPKFNGTDYFHSFIDDLRFGKPSKELWVAYVNKKVKNQEIVIEQEISLMEQSEAPTLSDAQIAEAILKTPDQYKKRGKYHVSLIENKFGIGHSRVYRIMESIPEWAEKKGKPEDAT